MNSDATAFDADRLDRARNLCREAVQRGDVPAVALAVALAVAQRGRLILNDAWGQVGDPAAGWTREEGGSDRGTEGLRDRPGSGSLRPSVSPSLPPSISPSFPDVGRRPATPETIWLIASVTKPVVCAGICLLIERGELALDDPVSRFLPQFQGDDRAGVKIRHLLTHTSGLPDMLPENVELRRQHAPPDEFVRRICVTPLLFSPGAGVSYQSTGIALLGAITERITGQPAAEFLCREFFGPLGMRSCALGWEPEFEGRAADCRLEGGQEPSDWDWNSRYWRGFAAPWGGMFATAPEFARYLQMLLNGGIWEGRRILGEATVRAMTRCQTEGTTETWGLGWRLAADGQSAFFGDLVSAATYGHGGATGTAVWNDPESGVSFVCFTNRPGCYRFIGLVSNAVASAVVATGPEGSRAA